MKFGKEWLQRFEELPLVLQAKSINYKHWKQIEKQNTLQLPLQLQSKIEQDINMVVSTYNIYKINEYPCFWCIFCTCCFHDESIDNATMKMYIDLNMDTLRKLVKRLIKRTTDTKPINIYNIPGYIKLTRIRKILELQCKTNEQFVECPICYIEVSELAVTDCGHAFCQQCARGIAGMSGTKTHTDTNIPLSGVLNYAHFYKTAYHCPMCRRLMPFAQSWKNNDLIVQLH